mmetsp:Transcript_11387/g.19239  ORF Transcript_11387/g.19239 Transcript_11387/m.19239 type:complete len:452 (+) Transcript_11387:172-1527(+)
MECSAPPGATANEESLSDSLSKWLRRAVISSVRLCCNCVPRRSKDRCVSVESTSATRCTCNATDSEDELVILGSSSSTSRRRRSTDSKRCSNPCSCSCKPLLSPASESLSRRRLQASSGNTSLLAVAVGAAVAVGSSRISRISRSGARSAERICLMRWRTSRKAGRSSCCHRVIKLHTATLMSWPRNRSSAPGIKCKGSLGSPSNRRPCRTPCSVRLAMASTAAAHSSGLGEPDSPLFSLITEAVRERLLLSARVLPVCREALPGDFSPKARSAESISAPCVSIPLLRSTRACKSKASTCTRSRENLRQESGGNFWSLYVRESKRISRALAACDRTASRQSSFKERKAVSTAKVSDELGSGSANTAATRGSTRGRAHFGKHSCSKLRNSAMKTSEGFDSPAEAKRGRSNNSCFNRSFLRNASKVFSKALLRRNCALNDGAVSSCRARLFRA